MPITRPATGDPFDSGATKSTSVIDEIADAIEDTTTGHHHTGSGSGGKKVAYSDLTGTPDDTNDPSSGEKAALAGTSGTPGSGNKFVTDADSRNTNSRAPSGSAGGDLSGTYPNPSVVDDSHAHTAATAPGSGGGGGRVGNVADSDGFVISDDFLYWTDSADPVNGTPLGALTLHLSGTGARFHTDLGDVDTTHPGEVTLETGTGTTGHAGLRGDPWMQLTGGEITFEAIVRINSFGSALSDGTDRYLIRFGLSAVAAGGAGGVFFEYSDNVNSGKWAFISRMVLTTTTDLGVTVATDTWYHLKFVVNAAGTSIDVYLDGSLVATVTTNIPSTTLGPYLEITKSLGTTSRGVILDMYRLQWDLTTPR